MLSTLARLESADPRSVSERHKKNFAMTVSQASKAAATYVCRSVVCVPRMSLPHSRPLALNFVEYDPQNTIQVL